MALQSSQVVLLCAIGIVLLARPAHAFGAGNIGSTSKIEGQNWRHGDLEDTLLTVVASQAMGGKKFGKLDVKRVYFGNWLRDYSQAVDVGTVKYVSAEAIRILLWVLGFMSFGYGSGEFEVTTDRLGCYRPEEHIDNPKDYADNEDARQYDRRLRGPVDERVELAINTTTGLKNYIASENLNIETSAGLVRRLLRRSIELGRQYARNKNKKDLYEALRLLGTACHCLEDFSAHSNYVELALIELGERDIFPHVGRRTQVQLQGLRQPVYPVVTGTFGGVDFLHSVCGEFDDKTTQSEIQELEGTMLDAQNNSQDESILQDLLNSVPSGIFGDKDEAGKASELKQNAAAHQMQNAQVSPRRPEEWTRYMEDVQQQILPIMQWHDEIMQSITETIEQIPILPDLIEQIQDEINKFVFTLLAPFVVPIINQVKTELNTGSNEIIQSSLEKQHIVFNDDNSSDPTHSMLSKDHFSNILNEPAGKVASQTIKWVVPQVIAAWDDERIDIRRTNDRIIHGVLHHPAKREMGEDGASDGRKLMFGVVHQWWSDKSEREKDGLREQLSRRGVESGRNHKPGVVDHGHGSCKPLGMTRLSGGTSSGPAGNDFGKMAGEAVGGGALGAIVGGLAGGLGGDLLGGGLDENKQSFRRDDYGQDGSHTVTTTQVGQSGSLYGQAQYSRTDEPHGGRHEEYTRYEQQEDRRGEYQAKVRREERTSEGRYHEETNRYESSGFGKDDQPSAYGRPAPEPEFGSRPEHHKKHHGQDESEFGGGGGFGRPAENRHSGGFNRRNDDNDEVPSYGRPQQNVNEYDSGFGGRQQQQQDEFGRAGGGQYGRPERQEFEGGNRFSGGDEFGERENRRSDRFGGDGEFGGGGRRRRQEADFGGGQFGGGRENRQSGRFGGGEGFGGRQQEEEFGSGGYGGGGRQQDDFSSGGYGREQDTYESGGYGDRRQEQEQEQQGAYGGGYGGGDEYNQEYDGEQQQRRRGDGEYGEDNY